jgi:DNA mismatch repair protein MutS2
MERYLEKLEYHKILERLAAHADFSGGADLARSLRPTTDYREARERLDLTGEARSYLDNHPDFALGGVVEVRPLLKEARRGVLVDTSDMLQLRDTLAAAGRIHRRITRQEPQFPRLADVAWRVVEQPTLVEAIGKVLNDRGEVRDNASSELARIRRELFTTQNRIHDKLQQMVSSSDMARYLQEQVVTRREGRYVIPVRAEAKGRVQGIVHDRSSSGVTVFMEPMAVVEMNNAVRELKIAEEEEVYRILSALTRQIAARSEEIEATLVALAELDLTFAKAKYAEELLATRPELLPLPQEPPVAGGNSLQAGAMVRLKGARHPLLHPETVVAVNLVLDEETHVLVITGPNTGGKTVSLKTMGLLTLMAQAGMHIPVDEGSALSCFEAVYTDIGDEQSIEQSLSTFSAHLANILSFLGEVDHRSLVLLDELGAGTDPAEGSALARALLENLREKRCTAFVATHYPELKLYAHNTPGVRNASMEFDAETLAPTFRLSIGLPGRSNAFAIARRLGMPESVVKAAQGMLSGEELRAEDMLEDLHDLRLQAARERDEVRRAQQEAEAEAERLRRRLADIDVERREVLRRAEEEAQEELAAVREELRALRSRMLTVASRPEIEETAREVEEQLEEVEERMEEAREPIPDAVLPKPRRDRGAPRSGDTVRVANLGMEGVLVEVDGEEATVQSGAVRTRVPVATVELVQRGQPPAPQPSGVRSRPRPASPGIELDLRGQTVAEANMHLERYLDNAALAELPWVRIIHGKGTGTLRRAVRDTLHTHPLVVDYEAAPEREGGDGVTVVHLVST